MIAPSFWTKYGVVMVITRWNTLGGQKANNGDKGKKATHSHQQTRVIEWGHVGYRAA